MGIVITQSGIAQAVIATVKLTTDWTGWTSQRSQSSFQVVRTNEGRDEAPCQSPLLL